MGKTSESSGDVGRSVSHTYQITWDDVLRAHDWAITDGGAPGILSEHGVRSAIARPYHGYYETLHEKVAALIHGVVFNHGFVDGNKRTALYLADLLIYNSGYVLLVDDNIMVKAISAVARREMSLEELSEWLYPKIVLPDSPSSIEH